MKETTALNSLLKKYRFTQAVPEEVQKRVAAAKRKNLALTLKKLHQYTPLFGAAAYLYLRLTEMGLKISLSGAKILVAAGALTLAAGIGTVTTFAVLQYQGQSMEITREAGDILAVKPQEKAAPDAGVPDKKGLTDHYLISIRPLQVHMTGKEQGEALTLVLEKELKGLLGKREITVLRQGRTHGSTYFLTGSVSGLGERLVITVRLFNGHSGAIILTDMGSCPGSEPGRECLEEFARSLGRKIAVKIQSGK